MKVAYVSGLRTSCVASRTTSAVGLAAELALLAQAPRDVLGAGDRRVDDHGDGDREPREGHRVEGLAEHVQHERRRHERERNRDEADQRRAPLEQEGGEDQREEHAGDQRRQREVVDRVLDEGRRPEDRRVGLHAAEAGPEIGERLLDALGDLESIGAGELLDHEEEAVGVVHDRIADQRLVVHDDGGDVGEAEPASRPLHGDLAQLLRVREPVEHVADSEPLLGVSMNPPVPGVEPSTKLSGEEICAFAVVSTTCCSVMPLAASRSGST